MHLLQRLLPKPLPFTFEFYSDELAGRQSGRFCYGLKAWRLLHRLLLALVKRDGGLGEVSGYDGGGQQRL